MEVASGRSNRCSCQARLCRSTVLICDRPGSPIFRNTSRRNRLDDGGRPRSCAAKELMISLHRPVLLSPQGPTDLIYGQLLRTVSKARIRVRVLTQEHRAVRGQGYVPVLRTRRCFSVSNTIGRRPRVRRGQTSGSPGVCLVFGPPHRPHCSLRTF